MNLKVFKRRVFISGLLIIAISIFFIIKLFTLHFSSRIYVSPDNNSDIRRGYITDKNGYIFAISIESNSLFANPEEIKNPDRVAVVLSPIINLSVEKIKKRILRKKRFVWLKRKIDDKKADEILKLGIKGLGFKKEYKRVYPQGELASNIIGFVGIDNSGLEGIEYSHDLLLSGRDELVKGNAGDDIMTGKNISLTINRFIQYITEREIENSVKEFNAKQGVVVVLEVRTGRILALAKYPNFNPNYYYRYPAALRRNFTVIDSFEPGSTLKIISLASILETNPDVLNQTFLCKGKIDISDITINCTGIHNEITMPDIIRHSCNVGIIKAIKKVKKEDFYKTLKKFGFGQSVEVELPGESNGILRPTNKWSSVSKSSISIGHEISVTSLQMVAAFGAIANNGVYISPSIIETVENNDGSIIRSFHPRVKGRILSKDIAGKLLKMMRGVVKDGTGARAKSRYYSVVGKTGTSKKFFRKEGHYSDRVISSFIGIAPYKNPEVCILIVIDDPADKLSGGKIAAPVFAKIVDRVLPQMGVKGSHITARPPLHVRRGKVSFDGKRMPDFRGLRLPESVSLLIKIQKRHVIEYSISGTGKVYDQKPLPGERLKRNQKIIIYLAE